MDSDLHKLRIDKSHRARAGRPAWPWLLGAFVVLAAGFGIWQWQTASAVPAVQTIRVRAPEGAAEADTVVLNATGYVMAAHKIELAAKVIGRVAWVGVEMGDKIGKGQELVRLEDDEFKARLAQQEGQLDNARALLAELEAGSRPQELAAAKARLDQMQVELTNAEIALGRLKAVNSDDAVSRQQMDDAEALARSRKAQLEWQRQQFELVKAGPRQEQIDAQRATVRQFEGLLATAKLDVDYTIIRSPLNATVLERNVEVGEFVTTGFVGDRGAKGYVVSIADLTDLRVELDISQGDFAKVLPRQWCRIVTDAYPDRTYRGVVDLISPEANRQKATVQVRVRVLDPDDLLKPDMNATVSFLAPRKNGPTTRATSGGSIPATQSAVPTTQTASAGTTRPADSAPASEPPPNGNIGGIRVPASAVRDGAVFVVENNKAIRRAVAVAATIAGGREVEIRKGLIGGEDLIVSPPESLQDGAKVRATSAN